MDGLILGLDLCDEYTQITCSGEEKFWTFPTVICKKKEEDCWMIGETAYASALQGDGIIVDKLVKLVQKDGTATIGGVKYNGVSLLGKYLEQVLSFPQKEYDTLQVKKIVITVPKIEARLMDGLMYCADALNIPRENLHVVSHTESFMFYVLSQKRDVWVNQVGLFDLSDENLCYYEMKVQRGMRQTTVLAEREKLDEGFSLDILQSPSGVKLADKILCSCGSRLLQKKLFSAVFLTGRGFENRDWAPEFMKMVCSRRRVYVEPALFAIGAACKAEDLMRDKTLYPFVFLCEGRLDTTVSTKIMHRDQEKQLILAAAGASWYESRTTVELILDKQDYLEFQIVPPDERKKKTVKMQLEGFPVRDGKTLRVRVNIGFLDERTMAVVVKDLGFGELFPATDVTIRQEVMI